MKRRRSLLITQQSQDTGYKSQYLTIVSETDNNAIGWKTGYANSARTISISTDGGKTWTDKTSTTGGVTLATLNTDDVLLIKGSNTEYFDEGGSWNSPRANMFTSSGNFRVEGNIMSLIHGDDFKDKVTLTTANSFRYMFYNCSKLTTAENCIMPATTLTSSCYDRMFSNCTILTKAPTLPAQTLVSGCYSYMFNGSRALNYIKCLAVNHSASNCTNNWVQNVASSGTFVKAKNTSWSRGNSAVPTNWTLDDYGCGIEWSASTFTTYMNNTSNKPTFSNPNDLPVTFSSSNTSVATVNSSGVVNIVGIGTTTLTASFAGNSEFDAEAVTCTLTVSKALAQIAWGQASYAFNVSSSTKPTFSNPNGLTVTFSSSNTSVATINSSGIITYKTTGTTTLTAVFAGNSIYEASTVTCTLLLEDVYTKYLCIESTTNNNTIYWRFHSTTSTYDSYYKTIEVSTDGGNTWTSKTAVESSNAGTILATLSSGSKLLIRGNNTAYSDGVNWFNYFYSLANINISGNLMSLLYGDSASLHTTVSEKGAFAHLFRTCKINSASNLLLWATTLSESCYKEMFYSSSIKYPPTLVATTLAPYCYAYMFAGTSLSLNVTLPSATYNIGCYSRMFSGSNMLPDCTNIDFTDSTTIASGVMIGLFSGTSVTYSLLLSILPVVNGKPTLSKVASVYNIIGNSTSGLSLGCYQSMFSNCTSLVTAPALPATTLSSSCYSGMFAHCTSLVNAPATLPATTLADYCYNGMFYDCTSLVKAPELPATTLTYSCYVYMFYGCTSLTTVPELPATTLTINCYSAMFFGCTGLTTAPTLSATTLVTGCYANMFQGCTSLNYIECYATNISATGCTNNWVKDVASSGTFVKSVNTSSWSTGVSGIPSGWTVETNALNIPTTTGVYVMRSTGAIEAVTVTGNTDSTRTFSVSKNYSYWDCIATNVSSSDVGIVVVDSELDTAFLIPKLSATDISSPTSSTLLREMPWCNSAYTSTFVAAPYIGNSYISYLNADNSDVYSVNSKIRASVRTLHLDGHSGVEVTAAIKEIADSAGITDKECAAGVFAYNLLFTLPKGSRVRGYLPSVAEAILISDNIFKVNSALQRLSSYSAFHPRQVSSSASYPSMHYLLADSSSRTSSAFLWVWYSGSNLPYIDTYGKTNSDRCYCRTIFNLKDIIY